MEIHRNNFKEYQRRIKEVVEASQADMSDDDSDDDMDEDGEEEKEEMK